MTEMTEMTEKPAVRITYEDQATRAALLPASTDWR